MDEKSPATGPDGTMVARANSAEDAAPDLDMNVLQEITCGSQELLQEIVGEYIAMAADVFATLSGALGQSDVHQIGRLAHTLKGSSGMIGAVTVMRASEALEEAALTGDMTVVRAAFAALAARHAATLQKLRALPGVAA